MKRVIDVVAIGLLFLGKILNLKRDDGFQMNEVIVALWDIMGLWPLVYSMLLLPTGRRGRKRLLASSLVSDSIFRAISLSSPMVSFSAVPVSPCPAVLDDK
ncbi:unnamed protein product [Fraxinus pennsylvanica]|uniref:Uncharacterized protein n=1 Tax=Fraxinus pennsylvanica TaxID=56036 RepID=A0AAD1ZSQ8_9LAMI|nr:unnamed protein product [Fraxinus pennsylvanica]